MMFNLKVRIFYMESPTTQFFRAVLTNNIQRYVTKNIYSRGQDYTDLNPVLQCTM